VTSFLYLCHYNDRQLIDWITDNVTSSNRLVSILRFPFSFTHVLVLITGTPRYIQVKKMSFHFNAITKFRPISVNVGGFNANCSPTNRERRGEGCVNDRVDLRMRNAKGEGKVCSICAISPSATFFYTVRTNLGIPVFEI
jgi:hypothetical protein